MCITNLLLICCFVGFAFAKTEAEVKNWFMENGALCVQDHSVTQEEFEQMDKHIIPDSRNAKCFIACIFKKVSWMDDQGMFSEENAVKTLEQDNPNEPAKIDNGKKLFATCKSVNEETYSGADSECERGASLAKCFIENAPKMEFVLP